MFYILNTCDLSVQLSPQSTTGASITPYSGEWTLKTAAHLLRRTIYAPRLDEIKLIYSKGLNSAVDYLIKTQSIPPPPLKHKEGTDEGVELGKTWINSPYVGLTKFRGQSLDGWYYMNLMKSRTNLQDRMVFFWLNYFGISYLSKDARAMYSYLRLYQEMAVGNFKTMIQRIAVEPAMLDFLDGHTNHKSNPNENFARELMELFTIQKGEQVAQGDYTNYTEQDVVALARALTGWRNYKFEYADDNTPVASYFDSNAHDTGDKQLSHRFNNAVIKNGGANEYKEVIHIIFQQDETSRAFCRELYRYFMFHEITDEVETEVIEPLAATLRANNFEIQPVLKELFTSAHFYAGTVRGAIIKNPHDFLTSLLRPFKEYQHIDLGLNRSYEQGARYKGYSDELNLEYLNSPTVSGWKAYCDAPLYYRHWISPSLLQRRLQIAQRCVRENNHINGDPIDLNWIGFINSLSNPLDVDNMIEEILLIFLSRDLDASQVARLKDNLLQGFSNREWINQCSAFIAKPNDQWISRPITDRLRQFFEALFGLAEFQLQ